MAFTGTPQEQPTGYDISVESSVKKSGAGTGTNVRNGSATLVSIEIQNDVAASTKSYMKFYDNDGSVLVFDGTQAPDMILPIAAIADTPQDVLHYEFPDGFLFSNGLSYAASKEAGKALTADPAQAVTLRVSSK